MLKAPCGHCWNMIKVTVSSVPVYNLPVEWIGKTLVFCSAKCHQFLED